MNEESAPWEQEPDRLEWRYHGLPCLIVRADTTGALCGYVGVPPGHPWHGKDCDDKALDALRVHGGVSFTDYCHGPICHVPEPGEPEDVWWLGFDTAHGGDYAPNFGQHGPWPDQPYRDLAYVRREVQSLADQVIEAQGTVPLESTGTL